MYIGKQYWFTVLKSYARKKFMRGRRFSEYSNIKSAHPHSCNKNTKNWMNCWDGCLYSLGDGVSAGLVPINVRHQLIREIRLGRHHLHCSFAPVMGRFYLLKYGLFILSKIAFTGWYWLIVKKRFLSSLFRQNLEKNLSWGAKEP